MSIADELRSSVNESFAEFAHANGLRRVAEQADRYGSLEWSASRGEGPTYILALDLTPRQTRSGKLSVDAETWGMIDTGTHYLRKRLSAWTIAKSATAEALGDRLDESWQELLAITPDEARTPYEIPHAGDPQDLIQHAAPAAGAPESEDYRLLWDYAVIEVPLAAPAAEAPESLPESPSSGTGKRRSAR